MSSDKQSNPCDACTESQECVDNQCKDKTPEAKCGTEVCTADQKCVSDKCVPKDQPEKCGNTECTGSQKCVDNVCKDLCGSVVCSDSQKCVSDQCKDLCGSDVCPDGKVCVENECQDPAPEKCGDAECTENQTCVDNVCKDKCGSDVCSDDQKCVDNECKDLCGSDVCPDGKVCVQDECQDPAPEKCGDAECTENQTCVDNVCKDKCGEMTCTDAEKCVTTDEGSACKELCGSDVCGDTQKCEDNTCKDLCGESVCTDNQVCTNSACLDKCGDTTCDAGMECDTAKNECVSAGCAGISCQNNEVCDAGVCKCGSETCTTDQLCTESKICEDKAEDKCANVQCTRQNQTCNKETGVCDCAGTVCGEGEACSDQFKCEKDTACENQNCNNDEICIEGQCLCKSEGALCGTDMICSHDVCIDKECETVNCGESEICVKGTCVEEACKDVSCTAPNICAAGECVDPKCKDVKCPEGKTCGPDGACHIDTTPQIKVIKGDNANTSEDGTKTVTLNVYLNAEPSEDVTVTGSIDDTTEGAFDGSNTLTFTKENYSDAQKLIIKGVADDEIDGNQDYTVTLTSASKDTDFDKLTRDTKITNEDNNVAAVVFSYKKKTTTEKGGQVTINASLASKPTADVTISVASSNEKEGKVDVNSLTFKPSNWNTPQTITVTGQDDNEQDGNQSYQIKFDTVTTTAPEYKNMVVPPISLVNSDDDKAGITITPSESFTVTEGSGEAFTIQLNTKPTENVELSITTSDKTAAVPKSEKLTFTPENYGTPQTVTIEGVVDNKIDGDQPVVITFKVTKGGSDYINKDVKISGITKDADKAQLIIACPATIKEGAEGKCTAKLSSEPQGDVKIATTSSKTTELAVVDSSITFKASDWNTSKDIKIKGVEDQKIDGNTTNKLTFKSTSTADTHFNQLSVEKTVEVTDINTATLKLDCADTSISEKDTTEHFCYLTLNGKPTKDITFTFTAHTNKVDLKLTSFNGSVDVKDLATGKLEDGKVVLKASKWTKTTDRIRFGYKAIDDSLADGDKKKTIKFTAASDDANFNEKATAKTITVTDDEIADIVMTAPTSVACGKSSTGSVKLKAQPTNDVTINLALSVADGLSVTPKTFTFTKANYDTAQKFTIKTPADNTTTRTKGYYKDVKLTASVAKDVDNYKTTITKESLFDYRAFCNVENTTAKHSEDVVLPPGTYKLTARGGKGGGVNLDNSTTPHGGMPAVVKGTLKLTEKATLRYHVGNMGNVCTTASCKSSVYQSALSGGAGSVNGTATSAGYSGGGCSTIILGSGSFSQKKVLILAAGGGGSSVAAGNANGGAGGKLAGAGGYDGKYGDTYAAPGKATDADTKPQTAGGSTSSSVTGAGGGGCGFFGGQAGKKNKYSGAAGNSFVFEGTTSYSGDITGILTDTHKLTSTSISTSTEKSETVNGLIRIEAVGE